MPAFAKMNSVEKDMYCQNVYNHYIVETSDFLVTCESMAKVIRAYIPCGCYTNFRDALFHFRHMVHSTEDNEIMCQAFAVKEHANRAKTDAMVSMLDNSAEILLRILKCGTMEPEISRILRSQLHVLRNNLMNCRLSGMMLENAQIMRMSEEDFLNIMEEYFECIREYANTEFKEVIADMRKANTISDKVEILKVQE